MIYDLSRTVVTYTSSYGWTSTFSVFNYYRQVYNGLMSLIGNSIGACALLGNLQSESYIVPFCKQGDTPPTQVSITYTTQINKGAIGRNTFINTASGYGLAQWTASNRKAGYYDYWKSSGIESIGDTHVGIEYLKYELQNGYKSTLDVLKTATDIKTASDYVLVHFESPKDQSEQVKLNRATMGEYYYKVLSGTPPTPTPTGAIEVSPLYVPFAFIGDILSFTITKNGYGTVTCIPHGGIQILSASDTECVVKCVGIGQAHLNVALHIGEQFIASSTATINIVPRSGKNKTILYGRNAFFKLFS